jgi:hypothetical protein
MEVRNLITVNPGFLVTGDIIEVVDHIRLEPWLLESSMIDEVM